MALVSVYLAETDKLFETCDKIDESKKNFEDNPKVNSSNSSVNAITSEINELGNEIKEDYKNTSNKLRDYTNKVENNEKELKSRAVSILDDSVTNDIPMMISNKKEEKVTGSFADSVKGYENNITNMVNPLDQAIGTIGVFDAVYDGQKPANSNSNKSNNNNKNNSNNSNSETLKDLADEFFETQMKNNTFVTSPIQSNTFASSVGNLNDISTSTTLLDPERISNAAENTKKENEVAEKRRQEEIKKREEERTFLDRIGATVGTFVVSIGEGVATLVQDVGKTGATIVHGVVTAFDWTGSQMGSIWNEDSMTEFDARNELRWMGVGDMLSQNFAGSGFDKIYDSTDFGQDLKFDAYSFDTIRNIGTGVGYVGGAVITGGAIGAASGVAGGTTAASAINAGVYGVARFGGSTGDAINDGASMDEAALYGLATGVKDAAGMFIGNQINQFNPFQATTPLSNGRFLNIGTHVGLDSLDGAVSAVVDPLLQSIYIPSEEKLQEKGYTGTVESYQNLSLEEKYKINFEANGGWNNVLGTAAFSGAMSLGSELIDVGKDTIKYNKETKQSANELYSKVAENNARIKDINNNGVGSDNLEDLLIERNNLKAAYDNLDARGKYYFNLAMAKDAINSGNITSAGIDNLLNSGNIKALYDGLSNQERLALFDAMNETQMQSYFDQIGSKEAQKFINKNSSYITDKFFNRDITKSIWSNNTSLAIPSVTSAIVEGTGVNAESISIMYSPYLLPIVSQNIDDIGSTSKISFQFFATPATKTSSGLKVSSNMQGTLGLTSSSTSGSGNSKLIFSKNMQGITSTPSTTSATGVPTIPTSYRSFSKELSKCITELSYYYGDAGYNVNGMLLAGKSISQIINKLNSKERMDFINFLQNTREGKYLVSLTNDEIEAIGIYTGGSYSTINNMVRKNNISGTISGIDANILIANMDSAIAKYGGLDETTEIYRAVDVKSFTAQGSIYAAVFNNVDINNKYEVYSALKVLEGKTYGDLGYMSTSPGYSTSFAKYDYLPIVLDIIADKGTPAAYVNQISKFYNSENELLLARGTNLYMIEVMSPQKDCNGLDKIIVKCVVK